MLVAPSRDLQGYISYYFTKFPYKSTSANTKSFRILIRKLCPQSPFFSAAGLPIKPNPLSTPLSIQHVPGRGLDCTAHLPPSYGPNTYIPDVPAVPRQRGRPDTPAWPPVH